MPIPEKKWTVEQVKSDSVTKKEVIEYIQGLATLDFLKANKLNGKLATLAKNAKKPALVKAYEALFESEANFQTGEGPSALEEYEKERKEKEAAAAAEKLEASQNKKEEKVEEVKFTKQIITKGDKTRFPKKGDLVKCFYTGSLPDGTVFDTNIGKVNRKKIPLQFKVGTGRVIRGWDEALLTMSRGEKAKVVIQPEWAYGFKGNPEAGIPPNTELTFEIILEDIV
ncbi:hypothetical protein BCR36DRAFT_314611 [Piromyces finnis]|uniref:peptidylprolyl isomerase n=1 Tax=Piromyces finnis TaxID=1754191 RepID=A0A1Y1VPJ3_9FUNG|nr:hypothetical protein BCR36DRAFT_314611 [Piromyces finnis]|eukprot:ORX60791.1 hypothetical protein BCR36DRAFT_314611 [Piromyces finnis]